MFKKANGNLDRIRKLAKGPTDEQLQSQDAAQPRWAARLLASPHRIGSLTGAQNSEVDVGEPGLTTVPGFPQFQNEASCSALPPAPAGISSEVWLAMVVMFDVKPRRYSKISFN